MTKKYLLTTLAGFLLAACTDVIAMEASLLAQNNKEAPATERVKTLKELSANIVAKKPCDTSCLCPDLIDLVKEKLLSENIPRTT